MRKIGYPFVILSIVGIVVYLMQKDGIKLPLFVNNYLNDLLIVPINLLAVQIYYLVFSRKIVILNWYIISACVFFYSVFFEAILPKSNNRYTADFWDVLCYLAGGWAFWIYQLNVLKQSKNTVG